MIFHIGFRCTFFSQREIVDAPLSYCEERKISHIRHNYMVLECEHTGDVLGIWVEWMIYHTDHTCMVSLLCDHIYVALVDLTRWKTFHIGRSYTASL